MHSFRLYVNTPIKKKLHSSQQVANSDKDEILNVLASLTERGCHLTFTLVNCFQTDKHCSTTYYRQKHITASIFPNKPVLLNHTLQMETHYWSIGSKLRGTYQPHITDRNTLLVNCFKTKRYLSTTHYR